MRGRRLRKSDFLDESPIESSQSDSHNGEKGREGVTSAGLDGFRIAELAGGIAFDPITVEFERGSSAGFWGGRVRCSRDGDDQTGRAGERNANPPRRLTPKVSPRRRMGNPATPLGGRSPFYSGWRRRDSCDAPRSSAPSVSSRCNLVSIAARAISSCFGSPEARSPSPMDDSEEFKPSSGKLLLLEQCVVGADFGREKELGERCQRGKILELATRLEIAIDVAHAITYLHMYSDNPIIHRDIKSSNILLTDNLRAKVADFGFARLFMVESDATHVSTQVKGTAGYLDPEYLRTYQLTVKSDVYSFGVLLVELVSGRRPIEPRRELNERLTANWVCLWWSLTCASLW
ncbi:hypothetical protein B296_00046515 [Ensete ventricosum]|uniref:Protein kinase domain-containing protein n=1 Tax=Ensete ventricosum TaxID=4639 RepID=A0A426XH68_ENSVE|nr:hypothetical protein B296_00046515 [Ensete ventricosum]